MSIASATDAFAALGLSSTATDAEIRKAYRKLSLQLHPDKNRDVDQDVAAERFHRMQVAYETLMDPKLRAELMKKAKEDEARRERRGKYEGRRKEMAEELEREEREGANKRRKMEQDARDRDNTVTRLKEEARRLREQREARENQEGDKLREKARAAQEQLEAQQRGDAEANKAEAGPPVDDTDLTVLLRYPASLYPTMAGVSEASAPAPSDSLTTPLARSLSAAFGPLTALLLNAPKVPKPGKKPSRELSALASFATLDSAYEAVSLGSKLRADSKARTEEGREILQETWIGWARGGKDKGSSTSGAEGEALPGEPERIRWLREKGLLGASASRSKAASTNGTSSPIASSTPAGHAEKRSDDAPPSFSFSTDFGASTSSKGSSTTAKVADDDFESTVLLRMRQAEMRRAEREAAAAAAGQEAPADGKAE